MEQKVKNSRGRPRQYDPEAALDSAMQLFWATGFAETSLDDLGVAMGMNRPSIYAAFGDKADLFAKALQRYEDAGHAGLQQALDVDRPIADTLRLTFIAMAEQFGLGAPSPRGCLLFTVGATEAAKLPGLESFLANAMLILEQTFKARFERAFSDGDLRSAKEPADLARLASSLVHSLATRVRAGESRQSIEQVIEVFVAVICGGVRESARVPSDGKGAPQPSRAAQPPRKA